MPRDDIRPEDEPAVVARCNAALDVGPSSIRALVIDCFAGGLSMVTLTELVGLLRRSAGFLVARNGQVVRV